MIYSNMLNSYTSSLEATLSQLPMENWARVEYRLHDGSAYSAL